MSKTKSTAIAGATALLTKVQVSAARLWETLHAAKCTDPAAWDALATILRAVSEDEYYQARARDASRMSRHYASITRLPELG